MRRLAAAMLLLAVRTGAAPRPDVPAKPAPVFPRTTVAVVPAAGGDPAPEAVWKEAVAALTPLFFALGEAKNAAAARQLTPDLLVSLAVATEVPKRDSGTVTVRLAASVTAPDGAKVAEAAGRGDMKVSDAPGFPFSGRKRKNALRLAAAAAAKSLADAFAGSRELASAVKAKTSGGNP